MEPKQLMKEDQMYQQPKRGRPRLDITDEERMERAKESAKRSKRRRKEERIKLGLPPSPCKNITVDTLVAARLIELREKAAQELGIKITTSQMATLMVDHWDKTHKGFKPIGSY